jgi:hypothetical protein
MAVRAYRVTVGTTATVLSAATNTPRTVVLGGAGLSQIDVGGVGVTHGAGIQGDHLDQIELRLDPDAVLYAITNVGTHEIQVLEIRQ